MAFGAVILGIAVMYFVPLGRLDAQASHMNC